MQVSVQSNQQSACVISKSVVDSIIGGYLNFRETRDVLIHVIITWEFKQFSEL